MPETIHLPLAAIMGLPIVRLIDIVDIVLVAALAYYIYRMVRGTNVMLIFWALIVLLVAWRIADLLGDVILELMDSEKPNTKWRSCERPTNARGSGTN